jgi:transposase-like protein
MELIIIAKCEKCGAAKTHTHNGPVSKLSNIYSLLGQMDILSVAIDGGDQRYYCEDCRRKWTQLQLDQLSARKQFVGGAK